MLKMGFPARWIDRIMQCVSSVTYSFLVNGKPTDTLIPQRGLRQGDPLPPYLFLLCAKGLGAMLKRRMILVMFMVSLLLMGLL